VLNAVDGVSFQIRHGEIVGFLGPTEPARRPPCACCGGLVTPTSGTALIDGIDIFANPLKPKPGSATWTKNHLSTRTSPAASSQLHRRPVPMARVQSASSAWNGLLGLFELADRNGELIGAYSHGMLQKIGLASLLIREPSRPLARRTGPRPGPSFPPGSSKTSSRAASRGTTVLFRRTSSRSRRRCAVAWIIDRGQIVATGTMEELRAQAGSEQARPRRPVPESSPRVLNRKGAHRATAGAEASERVGTWTILRAEVLALRTAC